MEERSNSVSTRYKWLDIARGICIICMITCHAFNWSNRGNAFICVTGTWFLVFFFFSSGICYSDKYRFKGYVFHQAKKLLLPYLAVTIFYLSYRVHYGMWHDLSVGTKIKAFFASLFVALPADFHDVPLFHVDTIGVGPIWFLPCMFLSGVLYKLLRGIPGKTMICVMLAWLASYSQEYIVLPFLMQNACIGCMFIAFGDLLKKRIFKFVEQIKKVHILMNGIFCIVSFFLHALIMICLKNQIVNLGGNWYSLCSLFGTFSGFLFLILLAVLIERTAILDDFLSYCGKETLLIVIFHNIDILIARNWSMRDNSFLFGTYLLYPFLAYILKRFRSAGKSYANNAEASKSKVPF